MPLSSLHAVMQMSHAMPEGPMLSLTLVAVAVL
jgi:hypothetical protein